MNEKESQVPKIDKDMVKFIIFKPFNEFYYSYSINSLDSQHLVERVQVLHLIQVLDTTIGRKVQYLIDRFFSFVYVVETKELLELEAIDDDDYVLNNLLDRYKDMPIEKPEPLNIVSVGKLFDSVLSKFNSIFK